MTSIYLAACFAQRDWLNQNVVPPLKEAGYKITSTWLDTPLDVPVVDQEILTEEKSFPLAIESAIRDLIDVNRADALVAFTDVPSSTGGSHIEFGYALGIATPIVIVGPRQNVFHMLPSVGKRFILHFQTVEEFLEHFCGSDK